MPPRRERPLWMRWWMIPLVILQVLYYAGFYWVGSLPETTPTVEVRATATPAPKQAVKVTLSTDEPAKRADRGQDRARAKARAAVAAKAERKQQAVAACDYDPCLKDGVGDWDCEGGSGDGPNYTGFVRRIGEDPYDLDRDGDGLACEAS